MTKRGLDKVESVKLILRKHIKRARKKNHVQFVNALYDHDKTHLPSPGSVQVTIERFPAGKLSYQHGGVYQHSDAKVRQQNLPRRFCVQSPPKRPHNPTKYEAYAKLPCVSFRKREENLTQHYETKAYKRWS